MEITPEKRKKLAKWIVGVAAACIIIYLGVQNIGVVANALRYVTGLIMPLLVGVAFAIIVNVPMSFFESHLWPRTKKKFLQKLRRPLAYIISVIFIIGVLVGVILLLIPELIEAVKVIVQGAIDMVKTFSSMTEEEFAEHPLGNLLLNINWDEILTTLQSWLKNQGGTIMNTAFGTIGTIVGGLFDLFISVAFSIYILFSKAKLQAQICRLIRVWMPKRFGEWLIHASTVAGGNFRNFISGQTIEALVIGVLCMIGMFIFGIPYAPMVGALVGVTALIPVVGAFIGAIVGAFMILTVDPLKAVIFVIFLVVLQQIEGNVIYPRVMGSRVKLPAMWILAAVTVGGGIAGAVGMLLSVPIASTAYVLIREATESRERLFVREKPDVEKAEKGVASDCDTADGDGTNGVCKVSTVAEDSSGPAKGEKSAE